MAITTDIQVRSAEPKEKTYRLTVGQGLYLEVTPKGGKYWRMKYKFAGKEKRLAIGTYPNVSLKAAKDERDSARRMLAQGIDPSAEKQARKASVKTVHENSFEMLAREFYQVRMKDKSESHRVRTWRCLEMYLFPRLAMRPINEITSVELLDVLRQIERTGKIETAHRAKQSASQVFRYAIVTGRCERDPAADLTGALQTPIKGHFSAITNPDEFGKLLLAIDGFSGTHVVAVALKCHALWFCRPTELRHLEWDQVNWKESRIEIIASKTKQEHIIPLARQSIELLEQLEPVTGRGKYLFPSARGASRPMSENAVRVALRTLGYSNDQMTAHGFRASARTMLDEILEYPIHIIEQQLAHEVKDPNGRSYNRTKHLSQRFEMMQRWADYLDQLRTQAAAPNVITANFSRRA